MNQISIRKSAEQYLDQVALTKSQKTYRAYRNGLNQFFDYLCEKGIDIDQTDIFQVSETWAFEFLMEYIDRAAPATIQLYYWAVIFWYKYLITLGITSVSEQKLKQMIRPHLPRKVLEIEEPPNYYNISRIVTYALDLVNQSYSNEDKHLRLLRDRALIITLTETGIEVGKIVKLRRSDIDWKRSCFQITDRKNKKSTIKFSPRVAEVLKDYLNARAHLDKVTNRSVSSSPVFANHGKGNNIARHNFPLGERSVHKIVDTRTREVLRAEYDGSITPRALIKYASSAVLLQAINFLHPKVINQCQPLFENGRYDDAIFNAMKLVEEEVRFRISGDPSDIGVKLISKALQANPPKTPLIEISNIQAEQEAAFLLFHGAIGSFKNPHSHRFIGVSDPTKTFECLALASLLLRILDEAA